jgi:hypothetical protein
MDQDPAPVTELLARAGAGDAAASAALLPLVYAELRSLAARVMDGERAEHTLHPTALVHEAGLRLVATQLPPLADRAHFARLAARAMRHVVGEQLDRVTDTAARAVQPRATELEFDVVAGL